MTLDRARKAYSLAVKLPVVEPAGHEKKAELIEILTILGKRAKQLIEDIVEREEEIEKLELELEEATPVAGELSAFIQMVYDMDRRLITPRELIDNVKASHDE